MPKKRGGRKLLIDTEPQLQPNFQKVLEDHTAGDPMKPDCLWTNLSVSAIADRMAELGTPVDRSIVDQLIDQAKLGRRQAFKTMAMSDTRDRNQQFEIISFYKDFYFDSLDPIVCIDTKKRELLGNFYRDGHAFTTQTIRVYDHDYPSFADGHVIPHGLFDLKRNRGYINLGGSCDTSEFACDSIFQWWSAEGRGETVYEPDITKVGAPIPQKLAQAGLRSLAAAPLGIGGKTSGIVLTARRAAHGYSSGDCEFLKQLSGHVFLAAQHAQLYQNLKTAYDELHQSQKAVLQQERLRALGQMASGIAHDINNAISPIAIYSESLLENEPNLSPRARDYLTTIQQAIDDVAQTVSRMRDFYRQQEKQITLDPVNLNSLVPQVVDLTRARWRDQAQQRGVTIDLKTELANDLPVIMGVESEIRDALTNLIFNAVDAMPQGGTLKILSYAGEREKTGDRGNVGQPTHVFLEVADTGTGMDEETRQRCLEPFFTTKGERGTGLGLAMVYGTMQRHSGDIEIKSAVGVGSSIRLLFPLPYGIVDEPARPERQAEPTRPLRVLIVDDDLLLRKSLQDALQADCHQVTAAEGGQAGIDAFRAAHERGEPFEIVITDLGMPYVDGRAVAQAVKETSPATAVILLTGWGQRMKSEGDIPAHVDRVLSKPPKLRELRGALAAIGHERKVPNDKH